ncbi:MAG: choice-of-anchor A family protein [Lachnospiraceae bacterium]|nr:choice-of-anchor A family protein [Lachnospiraceae bacterium]
MRGKAKRIVSIFLALMMILTGIPGRQAAVKKATAAGVTYTVDSSIENVVNVMDTYSLIAFGKFEVTGHQNTNLLVNEFYGLDAAESDRFKNEFSVRDVPAGNSHPNYVRHFGNMDKVHSTEQNVRLAIFGTNNEKFYIGEGHSIGTQWYNNKYRPTIDGHILCGSDEIEQDTATKKYIDLANLQKSAGYYSGQLAKMENNGSVETKNAQNDCYIRVNDNSGLAVVNVTAGQLSNVSGTDMRVYFPAGSTSGLLINVDMNGQSTFSMKHNSIYIGGNMVENSENVYNKDINRIYWNFYDSSKGDGNYTGSIIINEEVFGTFIAPYATYESKGVNGNIIVNNAKITGESHKILHIHNLPTPQPINVADFGIIKTYEGAELTSMSDSERSTLLSDTEFTVYKNDGTTVVAGPKSLSWNAGKQRAEVLFEDIVCGTSANEYYFKIKETKAPKDYTKSDVIVDCKVVRDAKTGLLNAFYKRSTEGDAAYKTDFPTFDNTKKTPIHPEVEIGNWKYGETAKEPSIKKGGNPGEATVSYTYYKKNSDNTYTELSGKPKDAGTYKVVATVSETDKYQSGTAEKEFHIDKADNTLSAEKDLSVHRTEEGHEANTIDLSKYIYNAIGNVTYTIEGNAHGCSVDPNTGVLTSNKDEGEVKVKITAAGNGNYKEKSVEIKVHVTKKNINEATAQMKGWTYGEGPNVPVVTGNQSDKDPEFSYRRKDSDKYDKKVPEEPGDYVVRVKIPGNKNYEETIILVEFSIEKATPTVTVSLDGWTYGETAKTPTHSEKGVKDEDKITVDSIRYKENGAPDSAYTTDVPTKAGTYVVCVTTKEDAKYLSTSETAEFTIAKATDPCEVTNTADVTRGHSIDLSTLVSGEIGTVSYEIASDNTGASISGSKLTAGNTTGTITVNVTIADSDNHKGRTEQITITVVDKKTISNPQVDIKGWTYGKYDETANKPSVPNASNPGGATDITYRYKRADEGDDKYTAEVPTQAGTYYVQAMIPETEDYCGATPAKQFEIKKTTNDMPTTAVTGAEVMRGGETSLKEYAKDSNGTPSYSIETPVSGVSIDSDGKLTVNSTVPKDTEITVTITTPGDGNHDAASRTVTIKVLDKDPSAVSVTVTAEKEYDGKTTEVKVSGVPDGVTPVIKYQKKNDSGVYEDLAPGELPKDAGTYKVIVTVEETATVCGTTIEKDIVISPAKLTVTADSYIIEYDSGEPKLGYTVDGLKNGDNPSLDIKIDIYPATLEVGNHSLTPTGEKIQGNYELIFVAGVLEVIRTELPTKGVTFKQEDIIYGEKLPDPVIKGLPDEVDPKDLIIEYKPKDGGSYDKELPTEAGEYTVRVTVPETFHYLEKTLETDFKIEPAKDPAAIDTADKSVYSNPDAEKPVHSVDLKNLVSGAEGKVSFDIDTTLSDVKDAEIKSGDTLVPGKETGTIYVIVTVADSDNHYGKKETIKVTVKEEPKEDPKTDPKEDPKTDPKEDPKTDPKEDPKTDPKEDPKTDPREDPKTDPKEDPKTDPKEDPKTDPKEDPKTDPKEDPKTDPKEDPKTDPAADPKKDPVAPPAGPGGIGGDTPTEDPAGPGGIGGDTPTEDPAGPGGIGGDTPTEDPAGPGGIGGDTPAEDPAGIGGDGPAPVEKPIYKADTTIKKTYEKGAKKPVPVAIHGSLGIEKMLLSLSGITYGGKLLIKGEDYTIDDKGIVTFLPKFLETLPAGECSISVAFADAEAVVFPIFVTIPPATDMSPTTGDTVMIWPLMLYFGAIFVFLLAYRRRESMVPEER